MSKHGPPPGTRNQTPGRKAIIVGSILIAVSIVLGVIGGALTLGRFDFGAFSRDVVIQGAPEPKVPGLLSFRVSEPLSGSKSSPMHVGVAVDYTELPVPSCVLSDSDGDEVPLTRPGAETTLMRQGTESMTVVGSAQLIEGDYEVRCSRSEGSTDDGATFTVGHAFGIDDLTGSLAPVLAFIIAGIGAILVFIAGVITLTVGLIRRGRARRILEGSPSHPQVGQPGQPSQTSQTGHWPTPGSYPPPDPSSGQQAGQWGQPEGPPTSPPSAPPSGPQSSWTVPDPRGPATPAEEYPWRTDKSADASNRPPTGDDDSSEDKTTPQPSGWTVPPSKK